MNSRDLVALCLEHGWKLNLEDYDHLVFCRLMRPVTPRTTMIGIISLAGYECFDAPEGSHYIYVHLPWDGPPM